MIKQLPSGKCVNLESIDDLQGFLDSEQLEVVRLLIQVKDEYIKELESIIDELEDDVYKLQDEIDELSWGE